MYEFSIKVQINAYEPDEVLALAHLLRLMAENVEVAQADPTQEVRDILEDYEVHTFSKVDFEDMYSTIPDYGSGPVGMPDYHEFTPVLMVFWGNGEQAAIGFRTGAAEKEFELNM